MANIARIDRDELGHRRTMTSGPSAAPNAARALRVLVVEDESLVGLSLQGVLRDLGHTVTGIAPSLRTALAIAAGAPSDLAIIDIGLAGDGGDGIDAAVALRQRYGIPAVLMTGASFADVADRLNAAEPLGFLTKPYSDADVERTIADAIARMQAVG
jgi:CheY-like chemotaxis protein